MGIFVHWCHPMFYITPQNTLINSYTIKLTLTHTTTLLLSRMLHHSITLPYSNTSHLIPLHYPTTLPPLPHSTTTQHKTTYCNWDDVYDNDNVYGNDYIHDKHSVIKIIRQNVWRKIKHRTTNSPWLAQIDNQQNIQLDFTRTNIKHLMSQTEPNIHKKWEGGGDGECVTAEGNFIWFFLKL